MDSTFEETRQRDDSSLRRSELMEEIVSSKPGFWIDWGYFVFLFVLIMIVGASWFIKYPDRLTTGATLKSQNGPKPIVTLVPGKLAKLSVKQNEHVHIDQVIAFIESTATHNEVLELEEDLKNIQASLDLANDSELPDIHSLRRSSLGELQTSFQQFSEAYLTFRNYQRDGLYRRTLKLFEERIDNFKKLNNQLSEQELLQDQNLKLALQTHEANERLQDEKVISAFDYRLEQSKLIEKKLNLPQIRSSIITNENSQNDIGQKIIELENSIQQQQIVFQQALNTFKSQIDDWKKQYILTSPIEGTVEFASILEEQQQLQQNEIICFVNPGNTQYYVELRVMQSNFGKIETGQKVILRFHSYPYQEYGILTGKIEFISHIPIDDGYLAKVVLTDGLYTSYGQTIQYRDGLLGSAEIITRDMRLLERLYYNLIKELKMIN